MNITDSDTENSVTITDYKAKEVNINVETSKDGFLFLGDMYFPGWRVYVDGNIDKIYRANYLFRGVFLEKGKHTVKFVYRPVSFRLGIYVTIATVLLSLILVLYQKEVLTKNIMRILVTLSLIFITVILVIFYQDYRKNLDPLYVKEEPFVYTYTSTDIRTENDRINIRWSGAYKYDTVNKWYSSSEKKDMVTIKFNGKALKSKILTDTNCGLALVRFRVSVESG